MFFWVLSREPFSFTLASMFQVFFCIPVCLGAFRVRLQDLFVARALLEALVAFWIFSGSWLFRVCSFPSFSLGSCNLLGSSCLLQGVHASRVLLGVLVAFWVLFREHISFKLASFSQACLRGSSPPAHMFKYEAGQYPFECLPYSLPACLSASQAACKPAYLLGCLPIAHTLRPAHPNDHIRTTRLKFYTYRSRFGCGPKRPWRYQAAL